MFALPRLDYHMYILSSMGYFLPVRHSNIIRTLRVNKIPVAMVINLR